jgi:hypothetical protein
MMSVDRRRRRTGGLDGASLCGFIAASSRTTVSVSGSMSAVNNGGHGGWLSKSRSGARGAAGGSVGGESQSSTANYVKQTQ